MKFPNTFLVWGPSVDGAVFTLDNAQRKVLDDQLRLASKHAEKPELRHGAYRLAFKLDVHYAVPCFGDRVDAAMMTLVESPEGTLPHRARQLAACIVTGTPYGHREDGDAPTSDGDGGTKVPTKPKSPRRPPGGNRIDWSKAMVGGAS